MHRQCDLTSLHEHYGSQQSIAVPLELCWSCHGYTPSLSILSLPDRPFRRAIMSPVFRIEEHLVPCQHIREYARATANEQEDVLHLAVKQYIPLDNSSPKPGDLTIIGAHANGFIKVCCSGPTLDLLLTIYRSYTSLCGKTSTLARRTKASACAVSGSQT